MQDAPAQNAESGVIDSLDALASLYGEVSQGARIKETDHLTEPYRAMIAAAPFAILATQGPLGPDLSPRGEAPGFVSVEDARRLLLPDRPGNNRLDSLRNILADPRVALLFLIPGIGETLRVMGRARIRADDGLRQRFAVNGRLPATVLEISVERAFVHCAKALVRSRLWDPQSRVPRDSLPSLGQMLAAARPGLDAEAEDRARAARPLVLY